MKKKFLENLTKANLRKIANNLGIEKTEKIPTTKLLILLQDYSYNQLIKADKDE